MIFCDACSRRSPPWHEGAAPRCRRRRRRLRRRAFPPGAPLSRASAARVPGRPSCAQPPPHRPPSLCRPLKRCDPIFITSHLMLCMLCLLWWMTTRNVKSQKCPCGQKLGMRHLWHQHHDCLVACLVMLGDAQSFLVRAGCRRHRGAAFCGLGTVVYSGCWGQPGEIYALPSGLEVG